MRLLLGRVVVAGAALGEATETEINTTNRGIAKTLLPRPPRRSSRATSILLGSHAIELSSKVLLCKGTRVTCDCEIAIVAMDCKRVVSSVWPTYA